MLLHNLYLSQKGCCTLQACMMGNEFMLSSLQLLEHDYPPLTPRTLPFIERFLRLSLKKINHIFFPPKVSNFNFFPTPFSVPFPRCCSVSPPSPRPLLHHAKFPAQDAGAALHPETRRENPPAGGPAGHHAHPCVRGCQVCHHLPRVLTGRDGRQRRPAGKSALWAAMRCNVLVINVGTWRSDAVKSHQKREIQLVQIEILTGRLIISRLRMTFTASR